MAKASVFPGAVPNPIDRYKSDLKSDNNCKGIFIRIFITFYLLQNFSAGSTQPQADPNSWNNGYYGYGNGYESYGYAPAVPQDPNMYYAGGYPGYGSYQQPPQQQVSSI